MERQTVLVIFILQFQWFEEDRSTDYYLISHNEYLAVSKSSGKIITAMMI
jgi:hypothetical protein